MSQIRQSELPFSPTLDPAEMQAAAAEASALLKALANESRLMILCHLSQGESSVGELQSELPLSQSALSQHLARLRRDGLVSDRRQARNIFYSLTPGPAEAVLETLYSIYCNGKR